MPIWIPMAIATGISTIAKLAASKHASNVAKKNTLLSIQANKEQAEKAYQIEKSNISDLNKYNSPISQMARWKEAGMNPNLAYTQGTPGNQTTFAKYNPPDIQYKFEPAFKGNELDGIANLPMMALQAKKLFEEGNLMEAKSKIETALSKFASTLAENKFYTAITENQKNEVLRFMSIYEFHEMFEFETLPDGNSGYRMRPDKTEMFTQWVMNKYLSPVGQYEKIQADISRTKSQTALTDKSLDMMSGILPWLQPLINFLRLLK
jgi:hypothetical protein